MEEGDVEGADEEDGEWEAEDGGEVPEVWRLVGI